MLLLLLLLLLVLLLLLFALQPVPPSLGNLPHGRGLIPSVLRPIIDGSAGARAAAPRSGSSQRVFRSPGVGLFDPSQQLAPKRQSALFLYAYIYFGPPVIKPPLLLVVVLT